MCIMNYPERKIKILLLLLTRFDLLDNIIFSSNRFEPPMIKHLQSNDQICQKKENFRGQSTPLQTKVLTFSIVIAILVILTKKYRPFGAEEVKFISLN